MHGSIFLSTLIGQRLLTSTISTVLTICSVWLAMQCVPSSKIQLTPHYSLVGRSRAGDGTCFVIPELKWMFDCGALVEGGVGRPHIIFLTHTHNDHILTLAQWAMARDWQSAQNQSTLKVYLPQKAVPLVEVYLQSYHNLITMKLDRESDEKNGNNDNNNNDDDSEQQPPPKYELIGITPGQEIELQAPMKKRKHHFTIRVVECVHRVDCVGYFIMEHVPHLKEEYQDLPGIELGKLRKSGVDVMTTHQVPIMCYLGDTTAEVFHKHPEILQQHSRIVVECSFLDEKSQENAQRHLHMHWYDLKPFIKTHPDTLFLLTHFSLRHSVTTWHRTFEPYTNVHPMLVPAELHQEWQNRQRKGKQQLNHNQQKKSVNHGTDEILDDDAPPSCNCFVCKPPSISRNNGNKG